MLRGPVLPLVLILLGITAIVGYRYDQYLVARNFVLTVDAPCDPSTQTCFISDCSPTTDLSCDTTTYEKVVMNDAYAPKCLEEHSCDNFTCPAADKTCAITFCSKDALADGETCKSTTDVGTTTEATATTTP